MEESVVSTPIAVRMSDKLQSALDFIVNHRYQQAPLLPPPTRSDVLRELVAEEFERINNGKQVPQ